MHNALYLYFGMIWCIIILVTVFMFKVKKHFFHKIKSVRHLTFW